MGVMTSHKILPPKLQVRGGERKSNTTCQAEHSQGSTGGTCLRRGAVGKSDFWNRNIKDEHSFVHLVYSLNIPSGLCGLASDVHANSYRANKINEEPSAYASTHITCMHIYKLRFYTDCIGMRCRPDLWADMSRENWSVVKQLSANSETCLILFPPQGA